MGDSENSSLGQIFQRAEALFLELQTTSVASNSPEYQSKVTQSIQGFERSATMIRQLSLFSDNEFLEDISAKDLRFFLTEYYLGELFTKIMSKNRLQDLKQAKQHLDYFLHQCESHDILLPRDKKYLESLVNNQPKDAATRRGEKIERFKREKDMRTRIQEFHTILGKTGQGSGVEGELNPDLEDQYRDFVLLHLEYAIFQTMEQLVSIQQETPMLEQMQERIAQQGSTDTRAAMRNNDRDDARDTKVDDSRIWNATGPLMDPQGRPLRPFMITNKRAEMAKGVFRPGHSLPTMTIDEYLQQEHERGNVLSGGTEEPKKKDPDDMDTEAVDAATLKAREWDNFKDDNPKGMGNRGGNHG